MENLVEMKGLFYSKIKGDKVFLNACKELYYWQTSYSSCFSNLVFDLIAKAQGTPSNKKRLMKGFPEYVLAYKYWQSMDEKRFMDTVKEAIEGGL